MAAASNDQALQSVADMIIIAFFFLLLPGYYTGTKSDSSPFRLSDVTFIVGRTVFNTATATDNELAAATFVILVFTKQKNGVRDEKIGHGTTGDPFCDQRRHCGGGWPTYDNMAPPRTPFSPVFKSLGYIG